MSVIRKQPYIESLLGSMSTANLKDLRTILNSGGDNVSLSFATLTNSYKNKVTPVYFQFEDNGLKTGILIWTNSKCALICYHKYQDLLLIELDPVRHTYQKINEYCDINELRRVLDDTVESTGAIDSGNAAAGTVPVADGDGGVEWADASNAIKGANVEEGNAIYLLGVDSSGNVIKDELPEGIVVDESLDEASTNAVANKPVAEAISDIQEDITEINEELETKANVDGNYPTMTVGMADNLTPYDESAGDDQDDPFSFQATGTGNGTQADFATGSNAIMQEKRGNSVVVNQILNDYGASPIDGVTTTFSNGKLTMTGTSTESKTIYINFTNVDIITGHKYLVTGVRPLNKSVSWQQSGSPWGGVGLITQETQIITASAGGATIFYFNVSIGDVFNYSTTPLVIDLTKWFNDNVPQDLLDHPENFFRYYTGSLAYNAGTIVNANSRYIKCIGRQQWDEEWEVGLLSGDTGANSDTGTGIRSKNYIEVVPNTNYYFFNGTNNGGRVCYYDVNKSFIATDTSSNRSFSIPSNCKYIRFSSNTEYGTSYKNDITISIYYSGESGYDQYYPYEVLTNNDTGTEELLAFDYKTPNGVVHKNTIKDTLDGTEGWSYSRDLNDYAAFSTIISGGVSSNSLDVISDRFVADSEWQEKEYIRLSGGTSISIVILKSKLSEVSTTAFKTWLSNNNVNIEYGVATPTTESGTPYSANLVIDDFGSMDFSGTSGVPQGNLIFYPVDYKAFVDTLYDYTEGTPSDIQLKSELSTAITTFLTGLTGYDATKTQVLKNVEGTLTWVDEEA